MDCNAFLRGGGCVCMHHRCCVPGRLRLLRGVIGCVCAMLLLGILPTAIMANSTPNPSSASGEMVTQGVWSYRLLLARGEYAQAERTIRQLIQRRQVARNQQWELRLDLLKAMRHQQRYDDARRYWRQLASEDQDRPEMRAEQVFLLWQQRELLEMTAQLRELDKATDPVSRLYAGYFHALLAYEARSWDACVQRCRDTLHAFGATGLYHHGYAWEVRQVVRLLQQLRAEAEHQAILQRYGEEYANYRRGRFAQQQGRYEEAIEHYRRLESQILGAAGRCYIAQSLVELKRPREAVNLWQRFIEDDPHGLYRGEAMLGIAQTLLQEAGGNRNTLRQASQWLERAYHWCRDIRQQSPPVDTASVAAIMQAFPVPATRAGRDNFGNYHRQHAGPQTIANRLTCTWYLDALQVEVMLLHAFTLSVLGQFDTATTVLRELIALNQAHDGALLHLDELPERLIADAANGSFVLPPAATAALASPQALSIRLAAFYFMAGEIQRASRLLDGIEPQVAGQQRLMHDWSAVVLLQACVAFEQGRVAAAISRLTQFETILSDTALAPLGILLLANIQAADRNAYHATRQRYLWIAQRYRRSELAPRALLSLMLCALNQQRIDDARQAWEQLRDQHGSSGYTAIARTLENRLSPPQGGTRSGQEPAGRVVPFQRHLVLPGHVDWTLSATALEALDIQEYQISYEVRQGCGLSSFWRRLNVFEPQPPPTNVSPLRFLRAPRLSLPPA